MVSAQYLRNFCCILGDRDVKMGSNSLVNLVHYEFELGWIEKNSIFFKCIKLSSTHLTHELNRFESGWKWVDPLNLPTFFLQLFNIFLL